MVILKRISTHCLMTKAFSGLLLGVSYAIVACVGLTVYGDSNFVSGGDQDFSNADQSEVIADHPRVTSGRSYRVAGAETGQALQVSADFPGGSGKVEEINVDERRLMIIPAEGPGWDNWWLVRIDGMEVGEEYILDVGGGVWAIPDRAVFSHDRETWHQTSAGIREGSRRTYRVEATGQTMWFAWGVPFLFEDSVELVDRLAAGSEYAESFVLTESLEGRSVPALRITEADPAEQPFGIWVQARQHAWEVGSSWVCKGFAEWVVSDDPRARNLRRLAVIKIVPLVDVDNVEGGAGGKDQDPQDHNRDWTDEPHWPEVAAAQEMISRMVDAGRFDILIDIHNPGAQARRSFFYISPSEFLDPTALENRTRFLTVAENEMSHGIGFYGQTYVSQPPTTARNWAQVHTLPHVVSLTLEVPWNAPESTPENYKELGRMLGRAMEGFLASDME